MNTLSRWHECHFELAGRTRGELYRGVANEPGFRNFFSTAGHEPPRRAGLHELLAHQCSHYA